MNNYSSDGSVVKDLGVHYGDAWEGFFQHFSHPAVIVLLEYLDPVITVVWFCFVTL